jgi:fatty acid desaturase
MQSRLDTNAQAEVVSDFVRAAKPLRSRAAVDLLVWAWGMLVLGVAVYVAFPSVFTFIFAFFVVTSRMGALLAIAHDAHHSAFLPSKKWNDLIAAWLCAYPVGSIYGSSRAVHMAHHKLLNTPDDPDRNFHFEGNKNTRKDFAWHFIKLVCGGQLWTSIVVNGLMRPFAKNIAPAQMPDGDTASGAKPPLVVVNRKGHPEILNLVPVQLIILTTLWLVSHQWWLYFALWLGPIFTTGTFLGFLRGFVDHARLKDDSPAGKDRLVSVRNTNFLERAFLAPYDFKYHAEHHMFPSVPHYFLPRLHELLQADPEYCNSYIVRDSYSSFIWAYWCQVGDSERAVAIDSARITPPPSTQVQSIYD